MNRDTQHVLLLLLGGALLRIAADDTFLRYVRPAHRPLLLAAGVVMVVLAVVAAVNDRRRAVPAGHAHGGAEQYAPWALLLPVLVLALVAPPALGADAVLRGGQANAAGPTVHAEPLPPDPVVALTVGEFVQRAVWDAPASLVGRQVRLTGFAVRRGADTELARLTISCCAADARVHRIRLTGPVGAVASDTWLVVEGELDPAAPASGGVPSLVVRSIAPVAAPTDPYEY